MEILKSVVIDHSSSISDSGEWGLAGGGLGSGVEEVCNCEGPAWGVGQYIVVGRPAALFVGRGDWGFGLDRRDPERVDLVGVLYIKGDVIDEGEYILLGDARLVSIVEKDEGFSGNPVDITRFLGLFWDGEKALLFVKDLDCGGRL